MRDRPVLVAGQEVPGGRWRVAAWECLVSEHEVDEDTATAVLTAFTPGRTVRLDLSFLAAAIGAEDPLIECIGLLLDDGFLVLDGVDAFRPNFPKRHRATKSESPVAMPWSTSAEKAAEL